MNNGIINWGIVGAGKIAAKFAADLKRAPSANLLAVASRTIENGNSFAQAYGVGKVYGDYDALFQDDQIDIVYIATPHFNHASLSISAMNNGRHVLCEKPLAVNALEVEAMIKASRQNKVFLMEGMWTRFNPSICQILNEIQNNVIGEIKVIDLNFCFKSNASHESRVFNPELAGGALLDIGLYPIFLAYLLCGVPEHIKATSINHQTGVDAQTAVNMTFNNSIASTYSSLLVDRDMPGFIYGTDGFIHIDSRWHETDGFSINNKDGTRRYDLPRTGNGFTYEIEEVHSCLNAGHIESSKWTHQNSLELINILDEVRSQIGLVYPFEVDIEPNK